MKNEDQLKSTASSSIEKMMESKRNLVLSLAVSVAICSTITIFAPISGNRIFYSDLIAVITSGLAAALSIQLIVRQRINGLFPRLYASLGLGIVLWFIAESIWTYYELVAGVETPFPSIADALWLAGYVPFFYFLFGMVKNFIAPSRSMLLQFFLISSAGFVLLANLMLSMYQTADLTSSEGAMTFVFSSAYPIADTLLVVLASVAFIQLRKGKLTFTPWAFFTLSLMLFIIADIGFAYFVLIEELGDMIWIWNPLYNAGYLAIASSLFWHREFFTVDERKLMRAWQERNR